MDKDAKGFDWESAFRDLTGGCNPFPWQDRLYRRFIKGDIPSSCDIPTGLGKTMVIPLWLLALAGNPGKLPRRLVYVVNRRTIVDQATDLVELIRRKLQAAKEGLPLFPVVQVLCNMATLGMESDGPLAVSTLRGEWADNQAWRFDPARSGVIVGTVDMVGSKLLFSGYGDSRRVRPLHAGLLGCDTLFIHDEAHLTPAFGRLLQSVQQEQERRGAELPQMRVMELSATHRDEAQQPLRLDGQDLTNKTVKKRFEATKSLCLHMVEKIGKPLQDKIVQLALKHKNQQNRVVVFVRSPEDAAKISEGIKKDLGKGNADRVSVLTGEIRGHERDVLLERTAMRPFLGKSDPEQTVYLVSTSAGEVGMDLHADHMVGDLTTLDSMIQRLGRVNRFGGPEARVDIVYETSLKKVQKESKPKPYELARKKTLDLFQELNDVSPKALRALVKEAQAAGAFSPTPKLLELTDIVIDLWSQTSLEEFPVRPEPAPWLHGIQENLPETWMAWRKEVRLFALDGKTSLDDADITRWFRHCPLSSKERLRMPTYRLDKQLEEWAKAHTGAPVLVLLPDSRAKRLTLGKLAGGSTGFSLKYATLVFPTDIGGLSKDGFFDAKAEEEVSDVANGELGRYELERRGTHYHCDPVGGDPETPREGGDSQEIQEDEHEWQSLGEATQRLERETQARLLLRLKIQEMDECEDEDEGKERWLCLLRRPSKGQNGQSRAAASPTVEEHGEAVAQLAEKMAECLGLPETTRAALVLAARFHDEGKKHERWQKAAGYDPPGDEPKAKPGSGAVDWRKLDGYRHELGSLIEAEKSPEIMAHDEKDLILHLIATHHGWARPHFEQRAFPPELNGKERKRIARETMLRYARLQERIGHWRLAWLESLLRRADGIASAGLDGTTEEES